MAKILVIEDEAILREEIVEWLTLEDYVVVDAENGIAGVEAALHHLPDLILCDILMPHLDGYGVLVEIHANPATVGIPFIFLTAKVAHDEIRKGMDLGADDYITKPFTRLELLQAIRTRLAKKNTQTHYRQHELAQLHQALTKASEYSILRAKLISVFSHDFANSLTSILMTNSLLRCCSDEMDPTRRLTHLNRIEASARLLLQMLDDLLIIAQMETGNLDLAPAPVNIGKLFQGIQEDCQTIYGERCLLLFEKPKNSVLTINERLFRLIVVNLIQRSVRSSSKGSTVRISVDNYNEVCSLTVQDEGMGMPEANGLSIADALQQRLEIDVVATIGLELAIVKQAVALQDGSIQFNSQGEGGTTINITIPTPLDEDVVGERNMWVG